MDERYHFVLRYMESSDGRCTEIEYYCGEWIFAPHGDFYSLERKMIWGYICIGAVDEVFICHQQLRVK